MGLLHILVLKILLKNKKMFEAALEIRKSFVVFVNERVCREFWMMYGLEAGVHYISVKEDFSDLHRKEKANRSVSRTISKNSRRNEFLCGGIFVERFCTSIWIGGLEAHTSRKKLYLLGKMYSNELEVRSFDRKADFDKFVPMSDLYQFKYLIAAREYGGWDNRLKMLFCLNRI